MHIGARIKEEQMNTIETEEDSLLPKSDFGMVAGGIYGDSDEEAFTDRQSRQNYFKDSRDYRTVVSCDKCTLCFELRRFTNDGKVETVGFFCTQGDFETDAFHTCNTGMQNRAGRRRVIYLTENMPFGFEQGMVPVQYNRVYKKKKQDRQKTEATMDANGYRGGSSYYNRHDGQNVGSTTVMPRRLVN